MFKRNQVEEAILAATSAEEFGRAEEVKTQLKRLLDVDRAYGRRTDFPSKTNAAFYDADPPGTGQDVLFGPYQVFALWLANRLLESGYPQGRAVTLLRHHRKALEREHRRMLAIDLEPIFKRSEFLSASPGEAAKTNLIIQCRAAEQPDDMVFFAPHADFENRRFMDRPHTTEGYERPQSICRGSEELLQHIQFEALGRRPVLVVEIFNPTLQLDYLVKQTVPRRRGRKG